MTITETDRFTSFEFHSFKLPHSSVIIVADDNVNRMVLQANILIIYLLKLKLTELKAVSSIRETN